jgi:hypothetical protein
LGKAYAVHVNCFYSLIAIVLPNGALQP